MDVFLGVVVGLTVGTLLSEPIKLGVKKLVGLITNKFKKDN